jgi:DNA-binding YbaB/EbfC family protein
MFDMFKMLGKLSEVQDKMEEVKTRMAAEKIEESELDGVVIVEISGDKVIRAIRTSNDFYEKYSKEEREEILAEAVNNAYQKAEARYKEEMKNEMKDIMPNIPGLDLSNLPFFNM